MLIGAKNVETERNRRCGDMKIVASWGMRLLGAYLILVGLMALVPVLNFIPSVIIALVALAAGVLILIGR